MSVDYFDDEFLEKIPSIAPDLMFVEENQQQQQQQVDSVASSSTLPQLAIRLDEKDDIIVTDDKPSSELEILSSQTDEILIEVDNTEPITPQEEQPPDEIVLEEVLENIKEEVEEEPIVLTGQHKENLLNFIIDDHAYARPFPDIKEETQTTYSPITTILKLHPKDLPPKKKYKKRGSKGKPVNEDDVDITAVDKPDDMLVK